MTEENKNTTPEGQQGADLKAELEKTRASNKALKIAAAGLALLFLILAGVAFFAYRKISAAKAIFDDTMQGVPPGSGSSSESRTIPGLTTSTASSAVTPISGLGLFSGELPAGGPEGGAGSAITPEDTAKITAVMSKYTQRPVWKELMADIKKDPEMARALDSAKGVNPIAMVGTFQKSKSMNKIMMKYATRPDFLKLMMEMMNDRDLKPLTSKLPHGNYPGEGVPVEPTPQVGNMPAAQPEESDGGPLLLDPSVISGTASSAATRANKAPPPVDTGR